MGKYIEFGDSVCIVKNKISAMTKDQNESKNLIFYFAGSSDGVSIRHVSVEERDRSYEIIKKELESDD